MNRDCPGCQNKTISILQLVRSLIGICEDPQCPTCRAKWSVGASWQASFAGFSGFVFLFSVAQSIAHRSFIPYLLLPLAFVAASFFGWRYAKLRLVNPEPMWIVVIHYVILTIFLCLLIRFF